MRWMPVESSRTSGIENRVHSSLELLQDVRRRHHEDPLTPPAPDQLGQQDADLQRLAEPHHVGDEQPRLRVPHGEGELGRPQLVGLLVHEEAVGQREPVLGLRQRRLADHRLQIEAGLAVVGGAVGDQFGLARVEHLDVVEQAVEDGVGAPHEGRDTSDLHHPAVPRRGRDLAD
ncbi:hypothetical protein AB0N20_33815 [Streptomyces griseoincarnatus]